MYSFYLMGILPACMSTTYTLGVCRDQRTGIGSTGTRVPMTVNHSVDAGDRTGDPLQGRQVLLAVRILPSHVAGSTFSVS